MQVWPDTLVAKTYAGMQDCRKQAKLDHLLQINGLATKTADGLQAISWWKEGERALLQEYCEQDVRALARLLILNQIKLPKINAVAPNFVFGIASALAARRASDALRLAASAAEAPSAAPELDNSAEA